MLILVTAAAPGPSDQKGRGSTKPVKRIDLINRLLAFPMPAMPARFAGTQPTGMAGVRPPAATGGHTGHGEDSTRVARVPAHPDRGRPSCSSGRRGGVGNREAATQGCAAGCLCRVPRALAARPAPSEVAAALATAHGNATNSTKPLFLLTGMAPLFLWTAVLAAIASLGSVGVSAMPMLTEVSPALLRPA